MWSRPAIGHRRSTSPNASLVEATNHNASFVEATNRFIPIHARQDTAMWADLERMSIQGMREAISLSTATLSRQFPLTCTCALHILHLRSHSITKCSRLSHRMNSSAHDALARPFCGCKLSVESQAHSLPSFTRTEAEQKRPSSDCTITGAYRMLVKERQASISPLVTNADKAKLDSPDFSGPAVTCRATFSERRKESPPSSSSIRHSH